jgi:protein gp37
VSVITKIEWADATWNPVTGCDKCSAGCMNCYMFPLARRLQSMGNASFLNGPEVTLHPRMLDRPLQWKQPKTVFVNSMSDLFHDEVPLHYISKVFQVMEKAYWHRFLILTKRAKRLEELSSNFNWNDNIWMGVSVEDERVAWRIDHLRKVNAKVRFLSLEPLIGPLDSLDLEGIDWVIVGGESGPRCRPMNPDWVRSIRDLCQRQGKLFFFKQWGGRNKHEAGRLLDGRTYDDMPGGTLDKLDIDHGVQDH